MNNKLKILSHRGYWTKNIEANSFLSIKNSLEKGFGFESDVRDYCGKLVISHDIASELSIDADKVFNLLREYNDRYTFAINVKSDGLKTLLKKYLQQYEVSNYFLFDMSVPQMIEFKSFGLRFFTRQSEYEEKPCLYDAAAGVWIDAFESNDWITEELLQNHLNNSKELCIVSPDLHNKHNYKEFWGKLRSYRINFDSIMLCTDHPDEARSYFDEKD